MIINAGINRVVFDESYPDALSEQMLKEACVEMVNIKGIQEKESKAQATE